MASERWTAPGDDEADLMPPKEFGEFNRQSDRTRRIASCFCAGLRHRCGLLFLGRFGLILADAATLEAKLMTRRHHVAREMKARTFGWARDDRPKSLMVPYLSHESFRVLLRALRGWNPIKLHAQRLDARLRMEMSGAQSIPIEAISHRRVRGDVIFVLGADIAFVPEFAIDL